MSLDRFQLPSAFTHKVIWTNETARIVARMPKRGIFLTGIEASDPNIDGVRRNQLREAHDFYTNYKERLQKISDLGITYLRFGLPYSQVHLGKFRYDFSFCDEVLAECKNLGITVFADLLHFGLPDWLHAEEQNYPYFQNKYFPDVFAEYAEVFARRYPHIRFYTLINEPFVTAYLSSKLGLWNEHRSSDWHDDTDFIRAASNIARAAILAREKIEKVWGEESRPDEPIFIQNESFEYAIAAPGSGRELEAERFNLRRFTLLDLIFGRNDYRMQEYLISQGVAQSDLDWFRQQGKMTQTILGIDYYPTCIHTLEVDAVINHEPHMPYQLYEITKEYYDRYPLPLLHTEVNAWPEQAIDILQKTYDALYQLSREGYPILGMGWYGDDLQVGWHVAMCGPQGHEDTPVGLFYKGESQPVSKHFKKLLHKGFPLLATQIDIIPNFFTIR